ncbi:MAG: hypothetical protein GKR94_20985 [Gammaproteobacteria bacterium]|nr:hypothetical protein [Gammaproteobacteria bacterium]
METMQDWFGLKGEHKDFAIETDADARLFFARHELHNDLQSMLRRSFRTGTPPKMVLYGDWGVGKTHTMRHVEHVIDTTPEFPARIVFRELPDITSKSTFQVAHSALLDALSFDLAQDWVHSFYREDREFVGKIRTWTQSGDISEAFACVIGRGDTSRAAWDWLRGYALSAAEARSAGLGPPLSQSNDFVKVLRVFGRLCSEVEDTMLVFMLDEATKLEFITNQDAVNHWINAIKLISDQQTKDIGLIVSGSWIDLDNMAQPLQDMQVQSRFGESHYILLPNMDSPQTKEFICSLLHEWIDPGKREDLKSKYDAEADEEPISDSTFPFTEDGLDLAVDYACRRGGYTLPRDIQKTLDDLLNRAIDEDRHILSSRYVSSIVNA